MEKHGLIRSYYQYGKNNLFLSSIESNPSTLHKSNIYDLNKYQKVYQFLNSPFLLQKDTLYKCYSSMKKLFFEDYSYMPETYIYPEEKNIINLKFKNYKLDLHNLWLVKPTNNYGGSGVNILYSLENIQMNRYIITKYIKDVNLIKDKKYDLRLYVLITGLTPLRIYFYREGLVRIATEKYSLNISSLGNKYIHLTNMVINKASKKYIHPSTSNDENSNLWNIQMYKTFLKKFNIQWEDIRKNIKDIIIKSIISIYKNLTEENEKSKVDDQSFYEILGFDILITNEFIPILSEINYVPEMLMSNNFDKKIKSNLFADTLNLIGMFPFSRKNDNSLKNKFKYDEFDNDNFNNALCELYRPRGNYELIFPTKETIKQYYKYFLNISEVNKKFWEKISDV